MTDGHGLLPRLMYRPEEAAEVLGISRSTVYELIREGRLDSMQVGRSRRIPVAALDRFIAAAAADAEA